MRTRGGGFAGIVKDSDGSMARLPDLKKFSEEHGLKMVLISDMVRYRRKREVLVERTASARVPTEHGEFTAVSYKSKVDGIEHVAFVYGDGADAAKGENVLVRVHSECLTGDIFRSARCDCGNQLDMAMKKVAKEGRGVIGISAGKRGGVSASGISSARTICRTTVATRCRRTRISACPWTAANTGWARRS